MSNLLFKIAFFVPLLFIISVFCFWVTANDVALRSLIASGVLVTLLSPVYLTCLYHRLTGMTLYSQLEKLGITISIVALFLVALYSLAEIMHF